MKTIKKVMLSAMIVFFASANALAFEDSLIVNKEKSFDLVLSDVTKSTQITLLDRSNNILFKQTVEKGESFSKTFNLELLPEGDYQVHIENEIKVKVLPVELYMYDVQVQHNVASEIYKPIVTEKGGMVYVSQFSPNGAPLYVAIYSSRNELLYEETLKGKIDLGKKFDFSKSYDGEYRFYLESNGMSYDQLVYVEK